MHTHIIGMDRDIERVKTVESAESNVTRMHNSYMCMTPPSKDMSRYKGILLYCPGIL